MDVLQSQLAAAGLTAESRQFHKKKAIQMLCNAALLLVHSVIMNGHTSTTKCQGWPDFGSDSLNNLFN